MSRVRLLYLANTHATYQLTGAQAKGKSLHPLALASPTSGEGLSARGAWTIDQIDSAGAVEAAQ